MICKNTYNQPLSRVRVRAHITGVFVFLLSQVSQGICKWLYSRRLGILQTYFNRQKEEVPQIAMEGSAQIVLLCGLTPRFCSKFFLCFWDIFSPSVTLVTAKNQHRCWKARAYIRARGLEGSMWINKVRIREGRDTKRQGYEKTRREEEWRNAGKHCYT